jgi:hypothetical protein
MQFARIPGPFPSRRALADEVVALSFLTEKAVPQPLTDGVFHRVAQSNWWYKERGNRLAD